MEPDVDIVVVGAGMAGIYAVRRFTSDGWSVRCFERGDGVGGTWFWNRYPGCRCDVPSMEYSYSFDTELEQEWEWTERFAAQPEIERYLNHVADRFDVRRHITLSTSVEHAHFDDATRTWTIATDTGERVTCRYFVTASGNLSSANEPALPGIDDFGGIVLHTGHWPKEGVDLTGKRVGVIGTGSSGIQTIPMVAEEAAELTVFQRTPAFTVPAGNRPMPPGEQVAQKADYAALRAGNQRMISAYGTNVLRTRRSVLSFSEEEIDEILSEFWANGGPDIQFLFNDVQTNEESNAVISAWVKNKIAETVKDPVTAAALTPDYYFGCKRVCLDTNYYETFNRPNVRLVDLRATPIETITATGVRTSAADYELDVLITATGFDAMTGPLLRMDIRGRHGYPLADAWEAGPRNYMGLGVPGFPNLFTVTGPGSPSVLANMSVAIEQHVDFIADLLSDMRSKNRTLIEADDVAADAWVGHVNEVADRTLLPRCNSWYVGANIPGKPRVFMPLFGYPGYVKKCEEVAANDYEGFVFA